jgi:hypothetical protein
VRRDLRKGESGERAEVSHLNERPRLSLGVAFRVDSRVVNPTTDLHKCASVPRRART